MTDDQEHTLLRAVYEAARRVLRYNGVDNDRTVQAIKDLENAAEDMKLWDSGLWEFKEGEN